MENNLREFSKWLAPFSVVVLTLIGVTIGRASHWVNIKRRLPTLKEFLIEPIIIVFMSVLAAACLRWGGIEDPMILVGLASPFGHYGPRAIDWLISAVAKRFGFDIQWYVCPTDSIILNEKEEKDEQDQGDGGGHPAP